MLTRARGGKILDSVRETYHLIFVCADHHRQAHQHNKGITTSEGMDLIIDGYVTTRGGQPHYRGPDLYLASKYNGA